MTDWKGTRKRRDVWGWLSCSALSRTFFLQYWNMVPSVEVHLKKKKKLWSYFYKARTTLCFAE